MKPLEEHPVKAQDEFRPDILREAERLCGCGLLENPDNGHFLHVRGIIAADAKRDGIAIACLTRGLALDASRPHSFAVLGDVLDRRHRHAQAINAHLSALRLAPRAPSFYRGLARTLQRQERFQEAHAIWCEALRLEPDHAPTFVAVAEVLLASGRFNQALAQGERRLCSDPSCVAGYKIVGRALLGLREWTRAETAFRTGLDVNYRTGNPDAELHRGLGEALLYLDALEEAVTCFRNALNIYPDDLGASRLLAEALDALDQPREAVGAWVAIGCASEAQGRIDEARNAYREAVARKSDCLRAILGLGRVAMKRGNPAEAIRRFRAATAIDPEYAVAHVELGQALHLIGDFDAAWSELAWRSHPYVSGARPFAQPRWDGTALHGGTILLWSSRDEELTDTIQHLRYVRAVKATGARVVLEVPSRLLPLVRGMTEADYVTGQRMPLPPFDVQAPLEAIPAVLNECRRPTPTKRAYLFVDTERQRYWRERVRSSATFVVGLLWAGALTETSSAAENIGIEPLAALVGVHGVRFVSLQLGPAADELICAAPDLIVETPFEQPIQLVDLAAVVGCVDLVIAADSIVAHLAGALGIPVWTCLSHTPNWRWPTRGDDSPWYATMRLFRQREGRGWEDVLTTVREALARTIDSRATSHAHAARPARPPA